MVNLTNFSEMCGNNHMITRLIVSIVLLISSLAINGFQLTIVALKWKQVNDFQQLFAVSIIAIASLALNSYAIFRECQKKSLSARTTRSIDASIRGLKDQIFEIQNLEDDGTLNRIVTKNIRSLIFGLDFTDDIKILGTEGRGAFENLRGQMKIKNEGTTYLSLHVATIIVYLLQVIASAFVFLGTITDKRSIKIN